VSDELKNANISHVNVDYDRKAQVVHLKGVPLKRGRALARRSNRPARGRDERNGRERVDRKGRGSADRRRTTATSGGC
jgi:hypothetical protein